MKSQKKYKMNILQADMTLQNVFSACNIQQKSESVKKILARQKKEDISYRIILSIIFIATILMLLTPFYFHPSPANIKETESSSSTSLKVFQHHVENGVFYISFTGDNIDYDGIYLIDTNGTELPIQSYNEKTKTISFSYENEELNLYIPQTNGSLLHLLLSPKHNSDESRAK